MSVADRFKVVNRFNLCVLCLNNHGRSRCTFKLTCNVGDCRGSHHPLLHRAVETVQILEVECNAHNRLGRSVIFRMIPVTIHAGSFALNILAFLDEGSSVTLINDDIVKKLNVSGEMEPLVVMWTGNVRRYEENSRKVNLMVSSRGSEEKFLLQNARTVKQLMLPKQKLGFQVVCERYSHLRGLPVADHEIEEPKIMIGLDNLHIFAPIESRIGQPGEPIGVRTRLGWTVYGPERQMPNPRVVVNIHDAIPVSNQELHDILRSQYVLGGGHFGSGT